MNHWPKRIGSHFKLTFYLCLLTAAAVGLFLKDAPVAQGVLPTLYQWSVIGYYGTLLLLVALILLPLAVLNATRWLWPLMGWAWLVYLAIDIAVFNLYRFHLDLLMVEMFLRDFRGMGIPFFVLTLFALLALALFALVAWLFTSAASGQRHHWPWFVAGLALMPCALLVNSVIHIWASHYLRDEITHYRPFLPIYYPVEAYATAPRVSAWLPSVFPAAYGKAEDAPTHGGGMVQYPRAQPQCKPVADPPSILMIVLESWQADTLNPKITPNIARFAETGIRFTQHVSSGAATVPGLFGLMYGLHPNYYELTRSAPESFPSLFTETLNAQGYRTRVFTSTNLDGFSLRRMFFPKVVSEDFIDHLPDAELVDRYIATVNRAPRDKRFDFVFLTSSHSPYSYPPEYAQFKPLPLVEGGYAIDRQADNRPYKNDYYNSLYFLDALVGKLLDAVNRQGGLKNTWVIITGDHAEEFNENGLGYWGHGSNFTRWQTHTPMIVRAPGGVTGVEKKMSLHQDVVPTLMQSALGCASPSEDYSHGKHLFKLPESRGTVIASYMGSAYLIEGKVLERTTSRKYTWHDLKQSADSPSSSAVQQLRQEEALFLAR